MTNWGTSVITFNVHPQTNCQTLSIIPGNFLFCSDVRTFGCRLHAALWWPGRLFGVRHLVKSCGGFHFLGICETISSAQFSTEWWTKRWPTKMTKIWNLFASQKNLVPESINIEKLSTSTASYDPLKRRRAACALWQHRGFCSLWGRCLQGRAQERGHIEQLKPRVRHEALEFLHIFAIVGEMCWQFLLSLVFPSGASGSPRNRYQHLWCTQCGNHQGVTPGCQINVSFDHRVSKNSGVSERVGIDCSCFSLGDHHFSTRTCAEKMLWLRAISNVKATQSKPLRFCHDSPIWYRL